MTLGELNSKIGELLTYVPPDTPVVLTVGVLKGLVGRQLSDAEFSVLTFTDELEDTTREGGADQETDPPWIALCAGPELEIPPVL